MAVTTFAMDLGQKIRLKDKLNYADLLTVGSKYEQHVLLDTCF